MTQLITTIYALSFLASDSGFFDCNQNGLNDVWETTGEVSYEFYSEGPVGVTFEVGGLPECSSEFVTLKISLLADINDGPVERLMIYFDTVLIAEWFPGPHQQCTPSGGELEFDSLYFNSMILEDKKLQIQIVPTSEVESICNGNDWIRCTLEYQAVPSSKDSNSDGIPDCCESDSGCDQCPNDINGDQLVDFSDALVLLGFWGTDNEDADLNGDGAVGFNDLVQLISNWGPCSA